MHFQFQLYTLLTTIRHSRSHVDDGIDFIFDIAKKSNFPNNWPVQHSARRIYIRTVRYQATSVSVDQRKVCECWVNTVYLNLFIFSASNMNFHFPSFPSFTDGTHCGMWNRTLAIKVHALYDNILKLYGTARTWIYVFNTLNAVDESNH